MLLWVLFSDFLFAGPVFTRAKRAAIVSRPGRQEKKKKSGRRTNKEKDKPLVAKARTLADSILAGVSLIPGSFVSTQTLCLLCSVFLSPFHVNLGNCTS